MSARLSDVEKLRLRDRALWSQSHALFTTVESILAARLAEAEQRGAERVLTAVEALAEEWERYTEEGGNGRHGFRAYEYGGEYVVGDLRALITDQRGADS